MTFPEKYRKLALEVKKVMRSSLIKAYLEDVGKTGREIAEEIGVSSVAVHNVINRKIRSQRIAEKVAESIGKPLAEVFPEYVQVS
ncbi:MAG TPA: helix-turn-helix transcriptional regulator [Stenomitos sp.]